MIGPSKPVDYQSFDVKCFSCCACIRHQVAVSAFSIPDHKANLVYLLVPSPSPAVLISHYASALYFQIPCFQPATKFRDAKQQSKITTS